MLAFIPYLRVYCLKVSTWGDNLTQVKVTERGNLLTSAGPGLISLWKPNSRPLGHFRGEYKITTHRKVY